ncbi:MAG: SET domain-containing protein-lysine N-methyltransferase, partial [bacterium]
AKNKDEEEQIKLYINHSCEPNCGIRGDIVFTAIRDIKEGDEITIDYAFIDNEDYSFKCTCGSENCRKTVTGRDWKIKELQEKYGNYFATYLKRKFKQ